MRSRKSLLPLLIMGFAMPGFCSFAVAPPEMQKTLFGFQSNLEQKTIKTVYDYEALTFHSPDRLVQESDGGSLQVELDQYVTNGKPAKADVQFTEEFEEPFELGTGRFTVYTQGDKLRIEYEPDGLQHKTIIIHDSQDSLTKTHSEGKQRQSIVENARPDLKHFSPVSYLQGSHNIAASPAFSLAESKDANGNVRLEINREGQDSPLTIVKFSSVESPAMTSFQGFTPSGELSQERNFSNMVEFEGVPLPTDVENIKYKDSGKPEVIFRYSNIDYSRVDSPPEDLFTIEASDTAGELRGFERIHVD